MQKIIVSIFFLMAAPFVLHGMDEEKQDNIMSEAEKNSGGFTIHIISHDEMVRRQEIEYATRLLFEKYKQEYMGWKWLGFLRSEKYWESLKDGLEKGAIHINPISCDGEKVGFLSSVNAVQNDNRKAILILQSPYWMFSWIDSSDPVVSEIYALSSYDDLSFSALGFLRIDKTSLPEGLAFNGKYLPGWQTDDQIALWYYDAQHGANEWKSKFEELKKSEQELVNNAVNYKPIYKEMVLEWQKRNDNEKSN